MSFLKVFDALASTVHRDALSAPAAEAVAPAFRDSIQSYPWAVTDKGAALLNLFGVSASGFGFTAHPHPIHKIYETHMLQQRWKCLATRPSTVLFMKESKFQKLHDLNVNFTTLNNQFNTPKDRERYSTEHAGPVRTPFAFMHDALMFYTPGEICGLFLQSPKLERLHASLVIPAEASFGLKSLIPSLYNFTVRDGRLHYYLEGRADGGYDQPLDADIWLKIHEIKTPQITLAVTLVSTHGPFHNVMVTRGPGLATTNRFDSPSAILLPDPIDVKVPKFTRLVPRDLYDALFTYNRAVRTLRVTDPRGYVRTQRSKPEYDWVHETAWDYLADFALKTAQYAPQHDFSLHKGLWGRIIAFVRNHGDSGRASVTLACTYLSRRAIHWWHHHKLAQLRVHSSNLYTDLWPWQEYWRDLPRFITGQRPWRMEFYRPYLLHERFGRIVPEFVWRRFPQWRPSLLINQRAQFVVGVLGSALALYFLTRRYSLQTWSDRYMKYLHPDPFHVEWPTHVCDTLSKNFFDVVEPEADSGLGSSKGPSLPSDTSSRPHSRLSSRYDNFARTGQDYHPKALPRRPSTPVAAPRSKPPPPSQPIIKPIPKPRAAKSLPDRSRTPQPAPRRSVSFADIPRTPEPRTPPSSMSPVSVHSEDAAMLTNRLHHVANKLHAHLEDLSNSSMSSSSITSDSESVVELPSPRKLNVSHQQPSEEVVEAVPLLSDDPTAFGPAAAANTFFSMAPAEGNWTMRRRVPGSVQPLPEMNTCLLQAIAEQSGFSQEQIWNRLAANLPDSLVVDDYTRQYGLSVNHLEVICSLFRTCARVNTEHFTMHVGHPTAATMWHLRHLPGHWASMNADEPDVVPIEPQPNIRDPTTKSVDLVGFLNANPDIPTRAVFKYHQTMARAKNLLANMKNGFDGLFATILREPNRDPHLLHRWDSLVDTARPRAVDFAICQGFAGCGKSHPVAVALRKRSDYLVIVPTTHLREEWKKMLNLRSIEGWRVSTWESAMTKTASLVIVDEIFKMPNGYLDTLITLMPSTTAILALGDPLQGDYHSNRSESTNPSLLPEAKHLQPYFSVYCKYTYRLDQQTARMLGVRTFSKNTGSITSGATASKGSLVLSASMAAAETLSCNGHRAMTASSSQGITESKKVCIYLDKNWLRATPQVSLVACTRSRRGVHFCGDLKAIRMHAGTHPAFDALFNSQPIDYVATQRHMLPHVRMLNHPEQVRSLGPAYRSNPNLSGGSTAGTSLRRFICDPKTLSNPWKSLINRQHRMSNFKFDPYHQPKAQVLSRSARNPAPDRRDDLVVDHDYVTSVPNVIPCLDTVHLPTTRRPLHYDFACAAPEPVEITPVPEALAPCQPVYPGYDYEMLLPELERPEAPEDLEVRYRGQLSNQFPYIDQPFEEGTQTLKVIAPTHNSKKDPTLLPLSIPKRLKFRPSDTPKMPSSEDYLAGHLLFESYCEAMMLDPNAVVPFDPELFADCINENEHAQLSSKTKAVIAANASRSDPDWRLTTVRIFSKTQQKINEGSIFGPWKACQTLALMHDAMILIFGPIQKYKRAILERHGFNPKIFIYAGKSPFDLAAFVRKNFQPNTRRCWNDFTSFDRSQGAETVVFEELQMRRVSIPTAASDLFVFVKMNLSCQFGELEAMRHTGEPGTYDGNTDYDIAVTNLRYFITSTGGAFSGDDSVLPSIPMPRDSWNHNKKYFPNLQFKTETGQYATFCGYYVGHAGAVRCPKPLLTKLILAKQQGDLDDKMPSYLSEFVVGHSLGDEMWDMLPLDQVPYQSATYDFLNRHASRDLKVALNIGEVPDDVIMSMGARLSRAMFATLNAAQRIKYLKVYPSRFASWASSFLPKRD